MSVWPRFTSGGGLYAAVAVDPTLPGKHLPTFKFALEKSDGKVATVTQLPISKRIGGFSAITSAFYSA
ncbi:hypothetical protein ACFIOY_21965 [Bradyrhizobium sp. TZ2]